MKLLILFGPPAVGKLTVGEVIESQTAFKLFHNHQILDGVMHIFGRNSPAEDALSRTIREGIITAAAENGIDLIFTYVWNFSRDKGKRNIEAYKTAYESRGGQVYFAELSASADERVRRADDPGRYLRKPNAPTSLDIANEPAPDKFDSPVPFYYPDQYRRFETVGKTAEGVASEVITWLQ